MNETTAYTDFRLCTRTCPREFPAGSITSW
jgi:hypothetical protein